MRLVLREEKRVTLTRSSDEDKSVDRNLVVAAKLLDIGVEVLDGDYHVPFKVREHPIHGVIEC